MSDVGSASASSGGSVNVTDNNTFFGVLILKMSAEMTELHYGCLLKRLRNSLVEDVGGGSAIFASYITMDLILEFVCILCGHLLNDVYLLICYDI